jgi:DNA mismatch endonuclease (patch repair protein)
MSKENRRKTMQSIRSISKLENNFSKELWRTGVRFRKNVKSLFGKPDIAIKKYKVVIFIDSCFWHCCPIHGNIPKSNQEYWVPKLSRNKSRGEEVNEYYRKRGWYIKRIWEHEIKDDFDGMINEVVDFIKLAKNERR